MVKQQKKKSISITKPWLIIGVASLVFNTIVIVFFISSFVLYSHGTLDYAMVNTGINTLCSDKFKSYVEENKGGFYSTDQQRLVQTSLDYQCGKNGAQTYYEQGFNNYAHSLGIKTE